MSADSIVDRCMKEIPKCVAAGVVDMETGIGVSIFIYRIPTLTT